MSETVNIYRQASNIGNIKGSPKGSGHGGYVKAPEVNATSVGDLRKLLTQGKIVHLKVHKSDDYIAQNFLAGDKVEGKFVCPIKVNSDDTKEKLDDIISSVDTFDIEDFKIQNVFNNEKEALVYFTNINESLSKFDNLINSFAKKYNG